MIKVIKHTILAKNNKITKASYERALNNVI